MSGLSLAGWLADLVQTFWGMCVVVHVEACVHNMTSVTHAHLFSSPSYMKASQTCLTSDSLSLFNMALVLSLSRIHIFEDVVRDRPRHCLSVSTWPSFLHTVQVFPFMKKVVMKSYKDQERIETSKWMQGVCFYLTNMH